MYATFDQDHQIDTTSFFCLGVFRPGARLPSFLEGAKPSFFFSPLLYYPLSTYPTNESNTNNKPFIICQYLPANDPRREETTAHTGARVRSTPALFSLPVCGKGGGERGGAGEGQVTSICVSQKILIIGVYILYRCTGHSVPWASCQANCLAVKQKHVKAPFPQTVKSNIDKTACLGLVLFDQTFGPAPKSTSPPPFLSNGVHFSPL